MRNSLNKLLVKATGFKASRFREWRAVLIREGRAVGWAKLAWNLAWDAQSRLNAGSRADRRRWRVGMRQCAKCPVYNPAMKSCRDTFGMQQGCGCYMPLKRLAPGTTCWLESIRNPIAPGAEM